MRDESGLQEEDAATDERPYFQKHRRTDSDSSRLLPILLGVLLVVVFAGGIYYFISKRPAEGDAVLQSKFAALEQKIAGLEKQVSDMQGKLDTGGSLDPAITQRLEALAQKVEALEKRRPQPAQEPKAKPVAEKQAPAPQKHYHVVQKGETLFRIARKNGMTVEELRKLNNLPPNPTLRAGQKLLVSRAP